MLEVGKMTEFENETLKTLLMMKEKELKEMAEKECADQKRSRQLIDVSKLCAELRIDISFFEN